MVFGLIDKPYIEHLLKLKANSMKFIFQNSLYICILFLVTGKAYATGDSLHVLTAYDTIFIQKDSLGINYFNHKVAAKQTIYGICRFYGIKPRQLRELNPALMVRGIQIDELIKVPISAKMIKVSSLPAERSGFAPVYYEVKPGEGLFNISRNYFSIKPEKIMAINGMTSPELKLGQLLLIGWIPLDLFNPTVNTPKAKYNNKANQKSESSQSNKDKLLFRDARTITKEKEIAREAVEEAAEKAEKEDAKNTTESNKSKFENSSVTKVSDQGIAFWHKEMKGNKGLYVLHRIAPRGSIIRITNPMYGSTIYARVAGTISPNAYPDEVMIVVSPEVASRLGAKDARFFSRITYFKQE